MTITIPIWYFIIVHIPIAVVILFVIAFGIAYLHDMRIASKVARGDYETKCPYEVESKDEIHKV